ncbi:hypothetical protein ACQR1Y_32750 [Bradyrhizobium sp. HKCCYLRH3099]|uniref:hypothetical protein n=1 Tax=unclassified Bradyrhizobium TaxID=2631580 RepID=UPI003EB6D102
MSELAVPTAQLGFQMRRRVEHLFSQEPPRPGILVLCCLELFGFGTSRLESWNVVTKSHALLNLLDEEKPGAMKSPKICQ